MEQEGFLGKDKGKDQTIEIFTSSFDLPFKFVGRYRRDLEKKRWHYYERDDGAILHFKKDCLVCVIEKVLRKK